MKKPGEAIFEENPSYISANGITQLYDNIIHRANYEIDVAFQVGGLIRDSCLCLSLSLCLCLCLFLSVPLSLYGQ